MSDAPDSRDVDRLAADLTADDAGDLVALLPDIYAQLRTASAALLGRRRDSHTLQPTALVHEAWIRIAQHSGELTGGRAGFLRVAAKTMRHILINHAAAHNAQKRGGGRRQVDLAAITVIGDLPNVDLIALDEAMHELHQHDARMARVVELRFFAGCTVDETAEALTTSPATVERAWRFARAWLKQRLATEAED